MAGDWLKMEICTPNKPEILAMSAKTGLHPDMVLGKCFRLWGWFDSHTKDGNANGVTLVTLGYALGNGDDTTKFINAMVDVGWLAENEQGTTLPNFDYHNGETAKTRALGNKRQKNHRANSNDKSNDNSVTKALPEKRREEKNKYTDDFESFWKVYDKPAGKSTAFKIWKGIKPDNTLMQVILQKASLQAKNVERQFRKDAERWLKDKRWEDEVQASSLDLGYLRGFVNA